MKNYVVGIGEALWDVLPDGKKNLGGAPANFAYHAAQFGIDAIAVSALGSDELGDELCSALDGKGLEHNMQRVPYPTGTVQVTLSKYGVPSYDIRTDVAWDNIQFTPELEEIARSCRAVCFGSLAQRNAVSRDTILRFVRATPADCMRIFDVNLRQSFYTKEIVQESLELCNVLKINRDELESLGWLLGYGDIDPQVARNLSFAQMCDLFFRAGKSEFGIARDMLEKYGLDIVILTDGDNGSYIFTPKISEFIATPKVDAVDTVGAGDSFTGAFCAARLQGLSIGDSHRLAVNVSAYVCTQSGAMPALPESLTKLQ